MRFYFDTSVLVAASVEGHPHHASALQSLESTISQKHQGYVGAHGLAEVYAVLTRAPFEPRVYPGEAWKLIEASILPHLEVVTLTAAEYKTLFQECSVEGIIGGRVYDAIHVHSARKAKADRLYTVNFRDFSAIAPDDFRDKICAP